MEGDLSTIFCYPQYGIFPAFCADILIIINSFIILSFLCGVFFGACGYREWQACRITHKQKSEKPAPQPSSQAGSILPVILGLVVLVGLAMKSSMTFTQGPLTSMSKITRANMAQSDMLAATALIEQVSKRASDADCDADGTLEPLLFRMAEAGERAPTGGGLLPDAIGVSERDPWGTPYGYCVWDHGGKTKDGACGGETSARQKGGATSTAAAIAVISAGPDKIFQTNCAEWIDGDTPIVSKPSGSDDLIRVVPYAQFAVGWEGVDNNFPAIGDFTDIENANPNQIYCSGWITLSGLTGTKQLTYQEGAPNSVSLHHRPQGHATTASDDPADDTFKLALAPDTAHPVAAGDQIRLCGNAPGDYVTAWTHSVTIDGAIKNWNITTREMGAAILEISPAAESFVIHGFGQSGPVYKSGYKSVNVTNTGESNAPLTVSLQNTDNYAIEQQDDFNCTDGAGNGTLLKPGDSCRVWLRAITAETTGSIPDGLLTVAGGASPVTAALSATRGVGWPCHTVPEDREIGCVMTAAVGNAIVPPQSGWDNEIYIGGVGGRRVYAAKADEAGTPKWGQNTTDSEDGTAPNNARSDTDGVQNTTHLLNGTSHPDHPAAKQCADRLPAGTWYLPAQNELNLLWTNGNRKADPKGPIDLTGIGIRASSFYWSSTEGTNVFARIQRFSDGLMNGINKPNTNNVRCVRREPDTGVPVWATAAGALAEGTVGTAYTATVKANDPEFYPVTYAVQGTKPAWLNFNATTREISGTPTATGTASITIRATDPFGNYADRTFSIVVKAVDCTTGPIGAVCASDGAIYVGDVTIDGVSTRVYADSSDMSRRVWSTEFVDTGATDPANGLRNSQNATVVSKGASVYPAIWRCRDRSPARSWYLPSQEELDLLWDNSSQKSAGGPIDLGAIYIRTGTSDYYWSSTESSYDAAWRQRFSDGSQDDNDKSGNFYVRCFRRNSDTNAPIWETAAALPEAARQADYTVTVNANDPEKYPVVYTVRGTKPDWLTLNTNTGEISGTPTATGTASVTIRATDPFGNYADRTFSIEVKTKELVFASISAGGEHSCGITTSDKAYCWGYNGRGQLGNGNNTLSYVPVPVSGGHNWKKLSAGEQHVCGITSTGDGYCWGDGPGGKLGTASGASSNVPTPISGGYKWASIDAGIEHTCGITTTGDGYCWGENVNGPLGNGGTTSSTVPVPVSGGYSWKAISVAEFHSCGVTTAGKAYCWGKNNRGQIGLGFWSTTVDRLTPQMVVGTQNWASISAGGEHSCAITTTGDGYCWGGGGALYGGVTEITAKGDGSAAAQHSPVPISGGHSWKTIFASSGFFDYSCGMTTANQHYCWGYDNSTFGNNTNLLGGMSHSAVPVVGTTGYNWASISMKYDHSCGVTTAGKGYCWGQNALGQLGSGDTTSKRLPTAVSAP